MKFSRLLPIRIVELGMAPSANTQCLNLEEKQMQPPKRFSKKIKYQLKKINCVIIV